MSFNLLSVLPEEMEKMKQQITDTAHARASRASRKYYLKKINFECKYKTYLSVNDEKMIEEMKLKAFRKTLLNV